MPSYFLNELPSGHHCADLSLDANRAMSVISNFCGDASTETVAKIRSFSNGLVQIFTEFSVATGH